MTWRSVQNSFRRASADIPMSPVMSWRNAVHTLALDLPLTTVVWTHKALIDENYQYVSTHNCKNALMYFIFKDVPTTEHWNDTNRGNPRYRSALTSSWDRPMREARWICSRRGLPLRRSYASLNFRESRYCQNWGFCPHFQYFHPEAFVFFQVHSISQALRVLPWPSLVRRPNTW